MQTKSPRMGSNPLAWIKDSRENESQPEAASAKESKTRNRLPSNTSKHETASITPTPVKPSGLPSKREIQGAVVATEEKPKLGRPKTNHRVITKSTQEGLSEGWTRATFIVREEIIEKLKDFGYWERLQLKEVVDKAFESFLSGKELKPRAKR